MTTTPRLLPFIVALVIVTAIALIVFAAITAGTLPTLVFGVVVLGLISIGLATVGVNLYARYADAQFKRDNLKLTHIERMADRGFLVSGRGVPNYLALPKPESEDIPVSTSGITQSTIAPYQEDAFELLALTVSEPGARDSTQVMPYHKARKNDYFKDPAIWMRAVQFLLVNQIAVERYEGKRKLGTFVLSGTVGQAYDRMKRTAPAPLLREMGR